MVVVTELDMLLSIEVDVSVSVFVEDDIEVPSELDVVFFAVVDISIGVVLVCIFLFVVVSDVSVEMVCVVVVVVSAPVIFVLETDELSSVVLAFSVVDSDSGVGVVTDVDEFVDTSPAKVVMLIVEVSSVIVFPALVVRESLLVLVVLKIGGTLSVVELSCVLF